MRDSQVLRRCLFLHLLPLDRWFGQIQLLTALVLLATMAGCTRSDSAGSASSGQRQFINVGTAPTGGAFFTVGSAICEVVNENRGDLNWRVAAESTGGSMENIRLLSQGKLEFAMSNSSISYFAVRGTEGWEAKHDIRSVVTLFPNIAMFVTLADSGIQSIADLKGKKVYLGPEGAGFEYFVKPILAAHGLQLNDLEPTYGSQQSAVDLLGDRAVAAAMIGGGTPNPSLSQMAQANSIRLIPYDESARKKLIDDYSFFESASIAGGTYKGIDAEFVGLNVGSAHLITLAKIDDQKVYNFVKLIYENREKITQRHKAVGNLRPDTAARNNGTEYHPGAIRYFREVGILPTAGE
ncbi:MAG: TAXI family TRAP transporter solute-binding subunit [Pirellulaceae bacterium]|nr:TAXI family TRAP transporter solute-binding subunit [Pirellulaceae bacterium]